LRPLDEPESAREFPGKPTAFPAFAPLTEQLAAHTRNKVGAHLAGKPQGAILVVPHKQRVAARGSAWPISADDELLL
jgi:hypothetical protein